MYNPKIDLRSQISQDMQRQMQEAANRQRQQDRQLSDPIRAWGFTCESLKAIAIAAGVPAETIKYRLYGTSVDPEVAFELEDVFVQLQQLCNSSVVQLWIDHQLVSTFSLNAVPDSKLPLLTCESFQSALMAGINKRKPTTETGHNSA